MQGFFYSVCEAVAAKPRSRGSAASYLGGSGGMLPQKNFESWTAKNAFPAISVIYFLEITLHFTGEILTKVTNTFNEKHFY